MNLIKSVMLKFIVNKTVKANVISKPKTIILPTKNLIGYSIATTIKNNKQKEDIPPFYHNIYDNNKLDVLKGSNKFNMYCVFDMHANQFDFDYYIAVENNTGNNNKQFAHIQMPKGKYIQLEFLKRNNKTVSLIIVYIKNYWIKQNGYTERKAPVVILYDDRFHKNYHKYGCINNNYIGAPVATMYIPVKG